MSSVSGNRGGSSLKNNTPLSAPKLHPSRLPALGLRSGELVLQPLLAAFPARSSPGPARLAAHTRPHHTGCLGPTSAGGRGLCRGGPPVRRKERQKPHPAQERRASGQAVPPCGLGSHKGPGSAFSSITWPFLGFSHTPSADPLGPGATQEGGPRWSSEYVARPSFPRAIKTRRKRETRSTWGFVAPVAPSSKHSNA